MRRSEDGQSQTSRTPSQGTRPATPCPSPSSADEITNRCRLINEATAGKSRKYAVHQKLPAEPHRRCNNREGRRGQIH